MGKLVEGLWDCPYCKDEKTGVGIGIRAGMKNCPNCGAPQGEDTVFRLPSKITYVSKEEASKISRNPDWQCSFCGQLNSDNDNSCRGCGASREDSKHNYFQMREEKKKKEEEIRKREEEQEELEKAYRRGTIESEQKSFFEKAFNFVSENVALFGGGLAFIGLIIVLFLVLMPKNDVLNVVGVSWERTINIEELRTVKEDDWSVPSGGRVLYTKEEIHHYDKVIDHYETVTEQKSRQVIDHYETKTRTLSRQVVDHYEEVVTGYKDLGNGYFEEQTRREPVYKTEYYEESYQEPVYRTEYYEESHEEPVYKDVPVYKTKYYYEIDRWFYKDKVVTSGNDKEPIWGEVVLGNLEREGKRTEVYTISAYNSKEELKEYTLSYDAWNNINIGDTIRVKVHVFGRIEIIDEDGNVIEFEEN